MDAEQHRHETITFCSVSKGKEMLFSYCVDGDTAAENSASVWLEKAPKLHSMYSHSEENNTTAMLNEGEHTFLAINKASTQNSETFVFLKKLRDEFKKVAQRNDFRTEMESAVFGLVTPVRLPPPPVEQTHRSGSTKDCKKSEDKLCEGSDRGLEIEVGLAG